MNFSISVIIPVYNCELFIEKAILSALQQTQVAEVVVVDDGSKDNSLSIIEKLQKTDTRIKIVLHENKANKGRSVTRNLGIQKATADYIAFLDADDYFLENRFENDLAIFDKYPTCEGVYNAVGFHFYRTATEVELKSHQLYTVTRNVAPQDLFKNLLYGRCGHFHIDGLTVKKSLFDLTGFFDQQLVVAEDSDMFWKMAIKGQLHTGIINEPVAIRGVHEDNIFDNEAIYKVYNVKMHESVASWASKNDVNKDIIEDLLKWIWMLKEKQNNGLIQDCKAWSTFFSANPKLLFSISSIKYFPIVRFRRKLFPFLFSKVILL